MELFSLSGVTNIVMVITHPFSYINSIIFQDRTLNSVLINVNNAKLKKLVLGQPKRQYRSIKHLFEKFISFSLLIDYLE